MRKTLLAVATVFIILSSKAQILMTLQIPPSGVILKSQLWNILLVNSNSEAAQIQIALTMNDVNTQQPVLTALTTTFILNTGTTQILASDLSIQYNYLSPVVVDQDPNGFLPLGNYEVCITLTQTQHLGIEPLQECINLFIEPINPPLLNIPEDQSTSESKTPQLNWLPPAPLAMFSYLTYDLRLVEVQPGQEPAEAIQQNIPVLLSTNLTNIFCNYPSSNEPLDTSKLYAWQVIAKNNNQFAAQSEIWTFRVKEDSANTIIIDNNPYTKLRRQLNGSVAVCDGILRFEYNNEADDNNVKYKISSLEQEDLGNIVRADTIKVGFGENFIAIPLDNDNRLIDEKTYLLELVNSRNELWSMKFIYRLPEEAEE